MPLPFGLTNMFLSATFFIIGQYGRKYKFNELKIAPPTFILSLFSIVCVMTNGFYEFDMKYIRVNDAFMDIVVPVSVTVFLFYVFRLVVKKVSNLFENFIISVSMSGLVCIFVHMALFYVMKSLSIVVNELNAFLYAILVYAISWIFYLICVRFKPLSIIFLGKVK